MLIVAAFRHVLPFRLMVAGSVRCAGCWIGGGELEAERGAFANGALDADLAGVLLHDAVGDGEAEAGAFALAFLGCALGGEEGIVDAAEDFGRHAGAVVGDADFDDAVAVRRWRWRCGRRRGPAWRPWRS